MRIGAHSHVRLWHSAACITGAHAKWSSWADIQLAAAVSITNAFMNRVPSFASSLSKFRVMFLPSPHIVHHDASLCMP